MQNIIIGKGLLAKACLKSQAKNCLFYCSGVSDSTETKVIEFERERNLLINSISSNNNKCLIYFSSVSAPSGQNPYFQHKLNMENIIKENCPDYIILRLPRVAGPVLNSTLLSVLTKKIYLNEHLTVFDKAVRNLVDVEDIIEVSDYICKISNRNITINICPNRSFKPEELVLLIAGQLKSKLLNYDLVDAGDIESCILGYSPEELIVRNYFSQKENYLENIVAKYVPEIVSLIESYSQSEIK